MADLLTLAKRLRSYAKKIEKESNRVAIETAETILTDLVYSTPVDTSKALSNWQVSVGRARILKSQILPPYVPGEAGSTRTASAQEALIVGKKVLQSKKPGDRVILSNVAPYIARLNAGWSKQAPAGFVQRIVVKARNAIKAKGLKLNG